MQLTEVNIIQNDCQTLIRKGSRGFVNIFLFFICEYLHFSNIILNTPDIPTRPRCFINSAKERKYFEYSNINQQIFFTDVRYYHHSVAKSKEYTRNVVEIGRNVVEIGRNVVETGRNVVETGRNVVETGRNVAGTGRNVAGTGRNVAGIGYSVIKINYKNKFSNK
jgi:hypothetical protein